MSIISLRNTFTEAIELSIPTVPLSYENKNFDPALVDYFASLFYIPATVEGLGKSKPSRDDCRGIFQVSIFVKLNAIDYDNRQLQIAQDLKDTFFAGATVGEAYIESAELGQGLQEGGWFKRNLSINYISYQTR